MPKFRKKPVVIEAVQFTGSNDDEIIAFCKDAYRQKGLEHPNIIFIPTLEGVMSAGENDWIIKGVKGEFYPCKDEIFKKTYDAVNESVNA